MRHFEDEAFHAIDHTDNDKQITTTKNTQKPNPMTQKVATFKKNTESTNLSQNLNQ